VTSFAHFVHRQALAPATVRHMFFVVMKASSLLLLAVKKENENVVKLRLESGANVNAQDKNGKTALHVAVQRREEKIFQLLLECGANVDTQDKNGKTALHFAVERRQEKFVQLLLECGANVDAQDKDGKTVLNFAVEKGCSLIVGHVLKHCPDVNNKSNRCALNVAVQGRGGERGQIIENLLQYGFTVNPEDVYNCEFLRAAVEKGYLKIVEELLKYGIDVNKLYKLTRGRDYIPLHFATKSKQEEVVKLLISYGADVNAQDETGKPPIFYAVQNDDLKIIEVLLEHGANINARDEHGRTALHFTAMVELGERFEVRLHRDPDVTVEIAKLLLSRGANVNAQTEHGITTLHAASGKGYVKVVEALMQHNADVDSKSESGVTALHFATCNGHIEIVKVLLKFGASIDSKDKYGRTALHFAAKEGRHHIVRALLEHGSDINIMTEGNPIPHTFALTFRFLGDYFHDYYFLCRGFPVFGIVADILKRHIVKMKTANLYVNKTYLLTISNNDVLSDFQKKCKAEIVSMKSEKVGNANVSFYDILTKGISQLAMYAGNESIVQILRSDDYKIRFPIYASMINSNFRKGERRKELLEQGNKIFHSLLNDFPLLPHVCTEKIFSYLSDEDLRILIEDCKPISVSSPNADINNVVITSNTSEMS
jgi:ankyrin repeat protein